MIQASFLFGQRGFTPVLLMGSTAKPAPPPLFAPVSMSGRASMHVSTRNVHQSTSAMPQHKRTIDGVFAGHPEGDAVWQWRAVHTEAHADMCMYVYSQ